jgi:hypothetical protein
MSPAETSKQRAARVPADHYRRPGRLVRWKLGLAAAALLAAAGWWAWGFTRPDGGRTRYSHGPLAAVHTTWQADCESCHEPFRPINGNTWLADWSAGHGLGPGGAADRCGTCHAGPPHHARAAGRPTCGACHRDHRGPDASLVRLPDADCTGCHRDLPARTSGPEPAKFAPTVTAFATDHPAFRPLEEPHRRTLKFSHSLHLTPGMLVGWTLADITPGDRLRYEASQTGGVIGLTCASCHRLDSRPGEGRGDAAGGLPRSAGAYMLPVVYEAHCQGCHPLTFDGRGGPPGRTVPHRLQPPALTDYLTGVYAAEAVKGREGLFVQPPRPRPRLDRPEAGEEVALRNAVESQVRRAEEQLYFGARACGKCHEYAGGAAVPREVVPPEVPAVWFRHARFDHSAHRAVGCQDCHPTAALTSADPRTVARAIRDDEAAPPRLPNVESCRRCHAPPTAAGGGARHDCTECHTYHNGDHPLQGRGAPARGPAARGQAN